MRKLIAKVQQANPIFLLGVALVATAAGLLGDVALHAMPIVVSEIVGWF